MPTPKKVTAVDHVNTETLEEHRLEMIQTAIQRKKDKRKSYKKGKTPDPITPKIEPPSQASDYDKVFDEVFSFRKRGRINVKVRDVLDSMEAYAFREEDQEKNIRPGWSIRHYCLEQGWLLESFQDMVKRHEILVAMYATMKAMLGERREWGASTRQYDPGFILRTLAHYDPIHAEQQLRQATIQAQAAKEVSNEPINLTVTRFMKRE